MATIVASSLNYELVKLIVSTLRGLAIECKRNPVDFSLEGCWKKYYLIN
jgi:hypothetical protein